MMTGNLPLVSVLMTAYNREKYIGQAIESVLASTYTHFELIITDDGSKDQTIPIVEAWARKDARVKLFRNEQNLGDYPNRNQAASHAQGKYLKYVDSDDYIYPWALEQMVSMMEAFPEAGWGLCSMEYNKEKHFPFMLSPIEAYQYHYEGPGLFKRAPLSSIIRTDIFREAGGFKPIRMAGDFEMWHRLAQKYPVLLMQQGMVWYRMHDSQEINDHRKYIHTYEKIKLAYLLHKDCPLKKENALAIVDREKKKIANYLVRNLGKKDFSMLKINWANWKLYSNPNKIEL